jgi:pectate lyase
MKFSILSAGLLAAVASAAPTPTQNGDLVDRAEIAKRAAITESCSIGYASTNGGTKGGAGGATTTVSTYAQFTKAATAGNTVVVVSGPITQKADQVKVASDTTIIGKDSSVVFTGFGLYAISRIQYFVHNINKSAGSSRSKRTLSSVTWPSRKFSPPTVTLLEFVRHSLNTLTYRMLY